MEVSRVTSDRLTEEHLNAHYYAPWFLRNEEILAQCGLPRQAIGAIAIKCNCGATPKNVDYDGHGQGLIRTTDVRPNLFLESGVLRTKALSVPPEGATAAVTDDIVYTMSGTVGFAAVIPETDEVFSFSNTIARARLRKEGKYDPRFVAAFFNSRHGYTQSIRLVSGGIQGHVMPNPFKRLRVPAPDIRGQKYIGDKIRLAERLRAHAMELTRQTRAVLDCVVPPFEEQARKIARITPSLLSDRIDTQPYRTHYLSLQHALASVRCDQLSLIATVRSGDPVPSNEFCSTGIPLVRIRDISEEGFASPETYVSSSYVDAKSYASAEAGDIVIGMDGEFRAQFFLDGELPQFVNQRIAIVKSHNIRPELLTVWINRIEGQYQLNRWSVKTTVDHTSLEYIKMIQVPRLEPDLEEELANKLLAARLNRWFAIALTKAARVLVEALIEGRFTEDEFGAAESGLARGDRSLDSAILGQLTNASVGASDGQRLFPNIDALYAAIDEAERAHTNGETS